MSQRKKHRWPLVLLALVLIAAGVGYAALRSDRTSAYTQETAALRDLRTYYSFSGHLAPAHDQVQTAKESLKVREIYVSEGDRVAQGDALARGADGARLYAAADGVVEELYLEEDDHLQPGSQIARIVDYDTLEVRLDVDEYDIAAIAPGKVGQVRVNALDLSVEGTVTEVSRSATTEGGVSYFEVTMRLEAPQGVRAGMSVEVNLLHQEALGAVSLSLDALSYDEYNVPYVRTRNDRGEWETVTVETGVSDGRNVQILSGLNAGDTVYYQSDDMARFFAMMGGR